MVIKSFHAKKVNVLGFINKNGDLKSYMSEVSVKSDKVVEVFDDFSLQLTKPTVVVLDNASFRKSAYNGVSGHLYRYSSDSLRRDIFCNSILA